VDPVVLALVALLLVAVVAVIAAPLRRERPGHAEGAAQRRERDDRATLEAAREAKYLEIRDAELDLRTGKLSDEDFRLVDRALRAEAIEILRRLDALDGR
jgi:hypothetical protein